VAPTLPESIPRTLGIAAEEVYRFVGSRPLGIALCTVGIALIGVDLGLRLTSPGVVNGETFGFTAAFAAFLIVAGTINSVAQSREAKINDNPVIYLLSPRIVRPGGEVLIWGAKLLSPNGILPQVFVDGQKVSVSSVPTPATNRIAIRAPVTSVTSHVSVEILSESLGLVSAPTFLEIVPDFIWLSKVKPTRVIHPEQEVTILGAGFYDPTDTSCEGRVNKNVQDPMVTVTRQSGRHESYECTILTRSDGELKVSIPEAAFLLDNEPSDGYFDLHVRRGGLSDDSSPSIAVFLGGSV